MKTSPIICRLRPTEVHLEAANPLGVLHGLQTFLQLVRITPEASRFRR